MKNQGTVLFLKQGQKKSRQSALAITAAVHVAHAVVFLVLCVIVRILLLGRVILSRIVLARIVRSVAGVILSSVVFLILLIQSISPPSVLIIFTIEWNIRNRGQELEKTNFWR